MKRPGGFDREHASPSSLPIPSAERAQVGSLDGEPDMPRDATADEATPPHAPGIDAQETVDLSDLAGGVAQPRSLRLMPWRPHAAGLDPIEAAERRVREAEKRTKRRQRRETRRFTAAVRRSRRRLLIAGGAIAGLVVFVSAVVFTPLMAVEEVRVEGAQTVNAADLERALERFDGVPLALVEEREVLRALEAFPLIQRFAVERVPPHTLVVRVEERIPVIAVENDGSYSLYDAAGVLVGSAAERPAEVPLGTDTARQTSSAAFAAAAQVVRDIPGELRTRVSSAGAKTGQDVTLVLENGVEVFWGNPDKTKRKAVILQTMLASLGDRPVSHIDVSSTEAPVFR